MHIYINTVEKSRTARSHRTLTAALKRLVTQLLGSPYIFYHRSKILQRKKNYKNQSVQCYSEKKHLKTVVGLLRVKLSSETLKLTKS